MCEKQCRDENGFKCHVRYEHSTAAAELSDIHLLLAADHAAGHVVDLAVDHAADLDLDHAAHHVPPRADRTPDPRCVRLRR